MSIANLGVVCAPLRQLGIRLGRRCLDDHHIRKTRLHRYADERRRHLVRQDGIDLHGINGLTPRLKPRVRGLVPRKHLGNGNSPQKIDSSSRAQANGTRLYFLCGEYFLRERHAEYRE